jgi:hypothetical protein
LDAFQRKFIPSQRQRQRQRSVIAKSDAAFPNSAADLGTPPGILNVAGIIDVGEVGDNLDSIADAVVAIESEGGIASAIIASKSRSLGRRAA